MKKGYKFTSKKQSDKGIMATVLGIVAMVSFFVANLKAFKAAGVVGTRIGAAGFLSFVFALVGVILGIMSLHDYESFVWLPIVGTVICVLALMCWGWILMLGMGVLAL